ncbi:MAG: hypothetical protein Fur007_08020 [Rhodoferax sp.]
MRTCASLSPMQSVDPNTHIFSRRRCLGIGSAVLGATLLTRARADAPAQPQAPGEREICSSSAPLAAARRVRTASAQTLAYEGTHILAFGAMQELAARYQGRTHLPIAITGGGCDDAIAALRAGVADLGGLCCPVEATAIRNWPHLLVAHDWKAVVVHPGNPVDNLRKADLMRVASGDITSWRPLGGPDRPIALVVRQHCPDYVEPVRSILLANQRRWSARGLFVQTDEKIAQTCAAFESALGIVSWVYARPLVEAGALKLLRLNGVALSRANGLGYPLTGPLTLAFRPGEQARVSPFLDFVLSAQGQSILAENLIPAHPRQPLHSRVHA